MKITRLVLAAGLLAGAVPLRAQLQSDGLESYRTDIQQHGKDSNIDAAKVKNGEMKSIAALCAMKKIASSARTLTEITFAYADAYDKAGGNEKDANEAAQKVIKAKAAKAARSAVLTVIKSKLPFHRVVGGVDGVKGAVAQAAEGVGVSMCVVVAEKMVRQEFGPFASVGASGDKMLTFKDDAPFKEWVANERSVTEAWFKEQNRGGELKGYQKAFVKGYSDKLTLTYSDLKCTYYAFFTKGSAPSNEQDFCRANVSGKNPLMATPAS